MLKVTVFKDERTLARALATQIAATLNETPDLVLGLPTGRTPVRLYHDLGTLHADLSRATTFNLDEFLGIGPDHPGSYRAFMAHHLFSRVNIAPERIHVLNGAAPDPEGECGRYERAVARAGGPHAPRRPQGVDATEQRGVVWRRSQSGAQGRPVDGHGHHSPGAADC